MTKEPFETEIPLGFVGPVKLESGALLGMDGSLNTMHSVDAGKTWNNSGPMVDGTGTEFPSGRYVPRGLIRLAGRSTLYCRAYLRYDDRRYTQPHSKSSYFGYKLRILPVSWFYEGDASL